MEFIIRTTQVIAEQDEVDDLNEFLSEDLEEEGEGEGEGEGEDDDEEKTDGVDETTEEF